MLSSLLVVSGFFFLSLKAASLDDVEHIIIWMQENRAFDHYYGNMRGVRGFNDRASPLLPTGRNPFWQPVDSIQPNDTYMLPYPLEFINTSATCMNAPTMDYYHDIMIWNNGKMDAWNTAREAGFGMSYFNRNDLPFYYTLSDYFLIGDNYYQSTFTATNPNRLMLFSGSNGLSVNSTLNVLDDSEPDGTNWITMAEILQNAGISWKVYQQKDNFDDNAFAWFDQFKAAKPGNPLYDYGMVRVNDLVEEFENDIKNGTLPSVSWIVGPANLSEHATYHPQDGEDLSARLIKTLGKYPETYAKSVFILNYDEGGQFYDHLWTPTAPMNSSDGKSTVTTEGEVTVNTNFNIPPGNPIGPGFRVPLFIVSPFTRADGGIVFSELTDHTSVVKFVEKRFKVHCPNISPWRRAVMSDLLYAMDFDNPNYEFPMDKFPDTSNNTKESYYECHNNPPPKVPTTQHVPTQENGTKISRKLPYKFDISDKVDRIKLYVNITMKNIGDAGVVFHVFDYLNMDNEKFGPKKYTIEEGKLLWDTWDFTDLKYNLSLHGPNGYVRTFAGDGSENSYDIRFKEDSRNNEIIFEILCDGKCNNKIMLKDEIYSNINEIVKFTADYNSINDIKYVRINKNVKKVGNWYDFTITETDKFDKITFERRFMGRMETGKDSITDPAMANTVIDKDTQRHPNIDFYFKRITVFQEKIKECINTFEYGFIKDKCWA